MENQVKKMQYSDKNVFYPFFEGASTNPLFIEMAGIEQCEPTYRIRRHQSRCGVLGYVAQGSGIILDRGEQVAAPAGSIFLLEKHDEHDYWADPKDPWLILWFNISGELFGAMLSQYRLTRRVYREVGAEMRAMFERALLPGVSGGIPEDGQYALNLAVTEILIALFRRQNAAAPSPSTKFEEIKRYLDACSNPPQLGQFSLAQMEQTLNISLRQINRIYQRETGITPYEAVLERKARLAAQYLLGTALSVREISQLLGFSDPYYFSNFFKKRFGVSPAAYRKDAQKH